MSLAGVAALAALTGCTSLEVTSGEKLNNQKLSQTGTTVAHFTASNSGLYLLSIPLISGSTTNPGSMVFNEDTVNAGQVISMVTKES